MKIVKQVIEIGNGAAVYVPKEYSGREVIVILPEGINEIKKRILTELIDYMDNILGVYIYGSYARNEQGKHSDIDVIVIIKSKDEGIKNILKDVDVRVITIEDLKKAIKETPLLIMPILKEAKTLINPLLLEELRSQEVDFRKFKWNFDDIKRIIGIIEKFIELDEEDIASSHVYSLVMRIRGCYLIECLLKNKQFSNKNIKSLLINYGLNIKLEDIREDYWAIQQKFIPYLQPSPGLMPFVRELGHYGIPMVVGTSSMGFRAEVILKHLGLTNYLSATVTAEDVAKGKPYPDVFLESAKRIGVQPENCLVFEDAENGIVAARNAGMHVIGFKNDHNTREELAKADRIITSFSDVSYTTLREQYRG